MAVLRVIRSYPGWNVGDLVEASGSRLAELLADGVVEIITPDGEEKPKEEVEVPKEEVKEEVLVSPKRGRPKKK